MDELSGSSEAPIDLFLQKRVNQSDTAKEQLVNEHQQQAECRDVTIFKCEHFSFLLAC